MDYFPSLMEAVNLTVYGQLNLRGNVSVLFENCDLQGSISSYKYESRENAPMITLKSTDATITKESSGNSYYNNTADEVNIYNSDVVFIFVYIKILNAYDNSRIHNQNAQFNEIYLDETSTIVGDDMDFDGLSDDVETQVYNTDPENPDTDGDGYGDGEEIKYGGDPLDEFTIPADTENPSLEVIGISSDTYHNNITIDITSVDNRGIDYVDVRVNNVQIALLEVPLTEYWLGGNITEQISIDTREFADGTYELTVTSYDIHAKMSEMLCIFSIDNSPVEVNVVGPSNIGNNSRISSGIMLELEFSEPPQIAYYSWDGAPNSTILQYVPVGDGMHELTVYTSDAIGNWLTTTFVFEIDDSCMLIYLVSPVDGSYVNSGTLINIDFSDTPTNLTYAWNGGANETAPLMNELILSNLPSLQGTHTLEIWTNSSMGNWNYEIFTFTVDDIAPNIYLISPANGSTNESGLLIDITFSETLSEVFYAWDGGTNMTTLPVLPIGDGEHYLDIYAYDLVPNFNHTRFYFITDDPLVIILVTPTVGSVLVSNVTIDLSILGSEGEYTYNWDENENQTVSIHDDPVTPILDGIHILFVFAEDALGNTLSQSFSFTVANPEINITLVSPENYSTLKVETVVELTFSDTPVEIYYCWNGGNYSTVLSPIPAIEGVYYLDVCALNIHGSWTNVSFQWTVDLNDAPTVNLIYPTGGETISGTITLSWEGFDDDNDPLTYAIYYSLDNHTWTLIAANLDREVFAWDISNVPSGTYYLKVEVSDGWAMGEAQLTEPITIISEANADTEDPFGEISGYSPLFFVFFTGITLVALYARKYRKH